MLQGSRLSFIKNAGFLSDGRRAVLCRCSCNGNTRIYRLKDINSGNTRSCGCLALEARTKHGLYKHPLYSIHNGMMHRCYDPRSDSYINYGGRGIKVCKEWRMDKNYQGLKNFIAWNENLPIEKQYKPGLEIDRKNNDKGYYPWNCRWVTSQLNCNNRRNNKHIEFEGKLYFERFLA